MKTRIIQLILIISGTLFFAGCSSVPREQTTTLNVQAWEYKTFRSCVDWPEQSLNDMGKDGWILCGYTFVEHNSVGQEVFSHVFRRPKS
jgi:hypothetical protein